MQFDRLKKKRLGDILVDEGLVGKEHVIEALHEHQRSKRLVSDVLLDGGQLREFELAKALVEQQALPFVDLANYTIHKDLVATFPAEFLHRAAIVPMDRFGSQVAFACQELPAGDVAEELRVRLPDGCYFFVALSCEIRRVLKESAPLEKEEVPVVEVRAGTKAPAPGAKPASAAKPKQSEDLAWRELFDAANAAVIADLKPEAAPEE